MSGQPAPKPESLGAPVPGKSAEEEAAEFLKGYKAPKVPDPQASPEAEAQAYMRANSPAEVPTPPPDQFAPETSALGDPIGEIKDNVGQFKNFMVRLKTGLAANDTEKMNFLRQQFGPENVAMKDDKIYFRRSKEEKLKRLDPATLELVNDLIPDFARELVTEAVMLPGETAGGLAGGLAGFAATRSLTGAGKGAQAGAMLARAASVPMANRAADAVAEYAGVPHDPNRDIGSENAWGAGAEVALPLAGKYVVKPIAGQIAKRIPGTAAYKAAKEAGQKEVVALDAQGREFLQSVAELEQAGHEVKFGVQNAQTNSPKVQNMVGKVADSGEFQNKQIEVVNGFRDLLGKVQEEVKRRVNPGESTLTKEMLAPTLTNVVKGIEQAEGKSIGQFRTQALTALKNQKQQLPPETSQLATEMMKELGFQPKRVSLKSVTRAGTLESAMERGALESQNKIERVMWSPAKDPNSVAGHLGLKDPGEVRAVSNVLNEFGQLISRGNEARLTDVERMINRMGPLTDRMQGTQAGQMLGKLTSQLRQHRRDIIGNALQDPTDKVLFNRIMDDYSMIRASKDQLENVLRSDVTAKTIVSGMFKGKENLANVRAIKSILGEDSGTFGALREEFVSQLFEKHAANNKTGVNADAFLRDLKQTYGDDFVKEVFGSGAELKNLKNALTVGSQLERTFVNAQSNRTNEQAAQAGANVIVGVAGDYGSRVFDGMKNLLRLGENKENVIMELFNRDGIDKYIAKLPPSQRAQAAANLEKLMLEYNTTKRITDIGKDVTKRAVRADLRERAMGHD